MHYSLFRIGYWALVVFCLTPSLSGQEATIESRPVSGESTPVINADVVYGHKMGMALTLDVIQPEKKNGAAVVFVVSGGWNSNWFPPESYRRVDLLNQLVEKGYVVILLRHGSAPLFKVPDAISDVKQGVEFLHTNCGRYGFEPSRIGVCGMSAGGHLSLMLGTDTNQSDRDQESPPDTQNRNSARVAAVVAYFPPTDLRGMVGPNDNFPALDFEKKQGAEASPLVHVTDDDAPTLLVHGTQDRLVPIRHSQQIKALFDKDQVPCELLVIEGAGHGFRGEDGDRASQAALNWFERFLNPAAQK